MWESKYIGKPWSKVTDCYQWAKIILKTECSIELPDVSGLSHFGRAKCLLKFEQKHGMSVEEFQKFDLVLMKYVGGSREHHIGVYSNAEGGGVIHAMEKASIIFQSLTALKVTGWEIVRVVRVTKNNTKQRKSGEVDHV